MKHWAWLIVVVASCRSNSPIEQSVQVNQTTLEREAKFKPEAEAVWKEHQTRVLAEIAKLGDHPWAGTYYDGDGRGTNVTIDVAPESGFAYRGSGCLGVYDRNFGEVKDTTRGSLELHPVWQNDSRGMGVPEVLVVVPLGERRYLVPPNELLWFWNAVVAKWEPRVGLHGQYLLRKGDHEKVAEGVPQVPVAFQPYLLEKPVRAAVVAVGDQRFESRTATWISLSTSVTLDVGRNHGVLPGMKLVVLEPPSALRVDSTIEVTAVDESTCTALVLQHGPRDVLLKQSLLGWKLTTGKISRK